MPPPHAFAVAVGVLVATLPWEMCIEIKFVETSSSVSQGSSLWLII